MKKNAFHYQSYKNVDSILGNNALEIALYGYRHFFLFELHELFIIGVTNLLIEIIKRLFHPRVVFKPPCNV